MQHISCEYFVALAKESIVNGAISAAVEVIKNYGSNYAMREDHKVIKYKY